jgi:hypothetical protein
VRYLTSAILMLMLVCSKQDLNEDWYTLGNVRGGDKNLDLTLALPLT